MNRRAYLTEISAIAESLPSDRRQNFIQAFLEQEKNPVIAFGLNAFLGYLGADRFYAGQTLLGILKLFTLGGLGIWVFIDYFIIAGTVRNRNIAAARLIKTSMI